MLKTKDLEVNLMGMSWEEAIALKTVIEGAGMSLINRLRNENKKNPHSME